MYPSEPKWLGPYKGSELSFQDCEVLTVQNIPRKLLSREAELMQVKWFDYRRLHPMQATQYFMECYTNAYREFIRVAVNSEEAEFALPYVTHEYKMVVASKGKNKGKLIKSKYVLRDDLTFLDGRERLAFWSLRQLADKLCIRYDFFLAKSMKWYMEECFRRESLYAPRPGHIATNDELLATVMMAWEEEIEIRLQIPADPYFKVENFVGEPCQLDFEKFTVAQVMNRQHKRFSLSSLIYEHEVLRVEEATRCFGTELVSDAIGEIQFPN